MSFEQGVLVRNGKVVGGIPAAAGHAIWNAIKTVMTKRPALWFKDAHVTDDATNSSTDIEVVQTVTEAAFDALPTTAEGLYNVDDGTMVPLMAENVGFSDPSMSATDTKAAILEVKTKVPKVILDEKKVFVKGTSITIPNLSSYDYALISIALDSASQTVLIKISDAYFLARGADNQGTSIRTNIVQGAISGDVITFGVVAYILQGSSAVDVTTGSSFYIDRVIGFKL